LPSEEAILAVEHAVHAHNAGVAIIRTSHCSLNVAQILNRNAFVGSSQPPSLQMLHDNMHLGPSHTPHDTQPAATGNESDMQQTSAASVGHNAQPHDSHSSSETAGSDHQAANQQHGGQGQSAGSSNGSQGHNHQHPISHDHTGHAHQHDSSVRSISITCPGEVDMIRSVSSASLMSLCIVRVKCCFLACVWQI
jgi:G3E family GTPase